MEGIKGIIDLKAEEQHKRLMKPPKKKYMAFKSVTYHGAHKQCQLLEDQEAKMIGSRTRPSLNIINKPKSKLHTWAFRITALFAILLLISFYFIPFPINLLLFITFLVVYIVISFWAYIRRKRQTDSCSLQDMTDECSPIDHNGNDSFDQVNIPFNSRLDSPLVDV